MKCLFLTIWVWGLCTAYLMAQSPLQIPHNALNSTTIDNPSQLPIPESTTANSCNISIDSIVSINCNGDSTGAIYTETVVDTSACSSAVVAINEFLYDPSVQDGRNPYTGEYIELIGPPGTDISCYVLTDGDWTITFPAGSIIPPDGLFTIGNDSIWGTGTFDLDAENCNCFTDGSSGSGLLILGNSGEYIALYNALGTFLEGVIYGNPSTTGNNYPSAGTVINTIGAPGCPSSVVLPSATAFETAPAVVNDDISLIRDPDGSGAWVPQVGGSLNACNVSNNSTTVSYLWNTGDTTEHLLGIPAGTYTVIMTTSGGCADTVSYTLVEPTPLIANTVSTDISCTGDTTGAIDLTITGGTAPYLFNWSTGATTEDLDSLLSGSYCVTVTDSNACEVTLCDTIEEPFFTIPVDTFTICAGDSVQLQVNTNITTINWAPSGTLSNDTIQNPFASPTSTTTYIVSTVGTACTTMDSIVVIVDSLSINLVSVDPLCNGDTTGTISSVAGGNYTYQWNTGDTTANLINLGAGVYQLTVSSGACQDTLSTVLNEPTAIALTLANSTNPSCNGDSTGAIVINNTGGTTPYTYLWSNTATTQDLDSLPAGGYSLTLTDNNNCTASLSAVLTEPSAINIAYNTTNVSCGGSNDGTATVTPTGGTPGYTYLWDVTANNQTTATATNLASSTYSVTVTDLAGCEAEANGIFVNPGIPVDSNDVPLVILTDLVDCALNPIGAMEINTPNNYSYLWSNGATSRSVTGLAAGTYSVTVANALGCTHVQTGVIKSPLVPTINPFIANIGQITTTITSGTAVNINGGNDQSFQGVTYLWSSPSTSVTFATPTAHATTAVSGETGAYVLTLTATASDSTACQDTASVYLNVESVYHGMPTAFTPNGDGVNDLYRPAGLDGNDIITFRIYNRWGQEIYNGDNLDNQGWDGRFNGVEQPAEVYLFIVEYQLGANAEPQVRKGEFTLIR